MARVHVERERDARDLRRALSVRGRQEEDLERRRRHPRWSQKKHELFYLVIAQQNPVMVVPYRLDGDSFVPGAPKQWSPQTIQPHGQDFAYDVHPDGLRIVMSKPPDEPAAAARQGGVRLQLLRRTAARGAEEVTGMALATGSLIGPYEILEPLGAGGMGEVYRARDAKLNRDVAIKVLPELFSADPDRLARFRREAQVLASLNHQNIGHIYGLEDAARRPRAGAGTRRGPDARRPHRAGPDPARRGDSRSRGRSPMRSSARTSRASSIAT